VAVANGYSGTQAAWLTSLQPSAPLIRTEAPEDAVAAHVHIGEGNSEMIYTATVPGPEGNSITIAQAAAAVVAAVAVTGTAIIVTPSSGGGEMTVSGTLTSDGSTPATIGLYTEEGIFGTKPWYSLPDYGMISWIVGISSWQLESNNNPPGQWLSNENVATPDLCETWVPVGSATGTPSISVASSFTATDAAALVAATPAAAALVTAVAGGNGTGEIAATAGHVHLAGGSDGTAGTRGQDCIVAAADVYKCVRETPVKWVKLN
jgi:hypothetical protein